MGEGRAEQTPARERRRADRDLGLVHERGARGEPPVAQLRIEARVLRRRRYVDPEHDQRQVDRLLGDLGHPRRRLHFDAAHRRVEGLLGRDLLPCLMELARHGGKGEAKHGQPNDAGKDAQKGPGGEQHGEDLDNSNSISGGNGSKEHSRRHERCRVLRR
jgi:hypothetical protein